MTWMDACHGANPRFNLNDPDWDTKGTFGVINQTVGFLLAKNEKWVIISMELCEAGYARDVTEIPTAIVLKIEELT